MKAHVIIGANYGDEGKGLMVDYTCRRLGGKSIVVRFNGGAQAGHTVVTPDKRHVFSHLGSGSLYGAETYLGQNFICNPIMFIRERLRLGDHPKVLINPSARVTTYFDMMANQLIEEARTDRHGSCGIGIFETIRRNELIPFKITEDPPSFNDLMDCFVQRLNIKAPKMVAIAEERGYMRKSHYDKWCLDFADMLSKTSIGIPNASSYDHVIFEGAQGLLLDQDNRDSFPHLTPSNTGLFGAIEDMRSLNIDDVDVTYVTRTYLTRHGAGPLEGEIECVLIDATNKLNEFQGALRFAPLNPELVVTSVNEDVSRFNEATADINLSSIALAITHVDQFGCFENHDEGWFKTFEKGFKNVLYSYGPTAEAVTQTRNASTC